MATKHLSPQLRLANEATAEERQASDLLALVAISLTLATITILAMLAGS
jgi:hypothetical protein